VHGGRLVVGVHVRVVGHERGRAHVVVGGYAAPVGEHGIRAEVAAATVVAAVALALTFFSGGKSFIYLFIYLWVYVYHTCFFSQRHIQKT